MISSFFSNIKSLFFLSIAIFFSILLLTFSSSDPSFFFASNSIEQINNFFGILGSNFAAILFYFFGYCSISISIISIYLSFLNYKNILKKEVKKIYSLISLSLICMPFCCSVFQNKDSFFHSGGILGRYLYIFLSSFFGIYGFYIILLFLTLLSLTFLFEMAMIDLIYLFARFSILFFIFLKNIFLSICSFIKDVIDARIVEPHLDDYFLKSSNQDDTIAFWSDYHKMLDRKSEEKRLLEEQKTIQSGALKSDLNVEKYESPNLSIFKISELPKKSDENYEKLSKLLVEKLSRFDVLGKITSIKHGPVVTLFEFQPDIDSKVSKILSLENDLALALEALSVRIIAPIAGTCNVGFEVSNKIRQTVFFADLVNSEIYKKNNFHLPLILGKDTTGNNLIVDLVSMPHLLIAGSTGSGKSIAVNAMIVSLLCKLSPDQLKLIIVDPKRLDFSVYNDIAHLLFPIITDCKKVAPVLKWLVFQMEERYERMSQDGVRNIFEYKKKCESENIKDELPFIVLIIDELADLMMIAKKDIEDSIARLAQMARAAGIHLLIATQRPSVDVLTGLIKVNFPSRISFRVASKVDSRTILDSNGAEILLGKGDMLFADSQSPNLKRVHGAFISDTQVKELCNQIRSQRKPEYIDLTKELCSLSFNQDEVDPLFKDVIDYLKTIDEISISLLQRRFKIGFNRSASIIESLELQGKVLKIDGSKTRKVLR